MLRDIEPYAGSTIACSREGQQVGRDYEWNQGPMVGIAMAAPLSQEWRTVIYVPDGCRLARAGNALELPLKDTLL